MFKVGDVVIAKTKEEGNPYGVTTNGWTGEVKGIIDGKIYLYVGLVDMLCPCRPEWFRLAKAKKCFANSRLP